jgi:hypothetical protein
MGDYIETLPTDTISPTTSEQIILDNILTRDNGSIERLLAGLKEPVIYGFFFLILNIDFVSGFIKSTVPYTRTSNVSLLTFKTLIFITILFLIRTLF